MFATLVGAYPHPPLVSGSAGPDADALVAELLREQMDAGLGLLTDGHVGSPDPLATVAAGLSGFEVPESAETGVGAEGPRPRAIAEPRWERPITVAAWQRAHAEAQRQAHERGLQALPVKQTIVGPYSIGRSADPGEVGRTRLTLAAAEALNQELRALADAGTPVIQIDEDALALIRPDDDAERTLAEDAFGRLTDGLEGTHLCLAIGYGNAEHAGPRLLYDAPFSSFLFDLIAGPDNWRLVAHAPTDRGIVCGVADARTEAADEESVMVWAARYAAAINRRGLDRVGLAPSAGVERLSRDAARLKVARLAAAARTAAITDDEELRAVLDPRAVDARSAALGRYEPGWSRAPASIDELTPPDR